MNLSTVTDLACAVLCFSLAGVVLVLRRRPILPGVTFAASLIATGAMTVGLGLGGIDQERVDFWDRWTFAWLSLLVLPWLFFAMVFARENWMETLRRRWLILTAAVAAGICLAAAFSFGLQATWLRLEGGVDIALGSPIFYLHLYLLAISVAILATIEGTFRSAHEIQRWQIKHILLGIVLIFGFFTFYVALTLIQKYSDPQVLHMSSFAVIAACGCMGFSVHRNRSLNLRFHISHRLAYRSIALIATGLYLILAWVVVKWLKDQNTYWASAATFGSILLLALLFLSTTIRMQVRRWVQRNLFRSRYDYRDQWLRAVETLQPEPVLARIAEKLADFVQGEMGLKEVSTWIRRDREERRELMLVSARGLSDEPLPPDSSIAEAGEFIDLLEKSPEPFDVEEYLARPPVQPPPGLEILRTSRGVLCAPLLSGPHLVGVLVIGQRVTEEPPDREDRDFLRVIAGHAASQLHNAQLLETQIQAREAQAFRTLSTFLIHDLKNFTSTLNLIAQNAARHRDKPEFIEDAFRSILKISQTMTRLCSSLRTLSGGLRVDRKLGDLGALLSSVVNSFNESTGSRVKADIPRLPPVAFDAEQMETVLTNILLNAHQATGPGGAIEVSATRCDGWMTIRIRDEGPGISREFLEKELFVPFHSTKSGGTGIGLFQSKSIIEAHGGKIEVKSAEGQGTTVILHLPVGAPVAVGAGNDGNGNGGSA